MDKIQHSKDKTVKDIYEYGEENSVVVAAFDRYPVTAWVIYDPAEAVQIWAAERFSRLEQHIQYIYENYPGWDLHSAQFVKFALFPVIIRDFILSSTRSFVSSGTGR